MNNNINEGQYLIKDLIQGDESVAEREDFKGLSQSEVKEAFNLLNNDLLSDEERRYLLLNIWKINYRIKPPTIKEFLTEEWIGPTARNLFPHVRKILMEFWSPSSQYRNLVLASAIGSGKTFLSTISSLFVTTNLWCMRNPKKFMGTAQSDSLVHVLISFTEKKAKQLMLSKFYEILRSSSKFRRIRFEETIDQKQKDTPNQICYTSSGRVGDLQFFNDVHYVISSNVENILGLSLVSAIMSEISFFVEKGFSPEYIWRVYQDSKNRVWSRFHGRYFTGTILDSSPNDIDLSPIDNYIFGTGEAYADPTNYILTGPHWKFRPDLYPVWSKTGETFSVFRGSSALPPDFVTEENRASFEKEEVIDTPIDIRSLFEENMIKNVKDYVGWPSGSLDRLLKDHTVIEKMFTPNLRNIYSYMYAPASKSSEGLIWNQIVNKFFIKHANNHYEFYRHSIEKRYIHVDQGEVKDHCGIAMVHPEATKDGGIMYITDFIIDISTGKGRINLQAIPQFILDLRDKGRLNIEMVTFDRWQSKTTVQYLKEKEFKNVGFLSLDSDIAPYRNYISLLHVNRIRSGKNVVLKNNIKSLQEITTSSGKKKIDHMKGKITQEDGGSWNNSQMGKFAKDASDAHAGAIWNATHNFIGVPRYRWEEKIKITPEGQDITGLENIGEHIRNRLRRKYGMKVKSA